MTALEMIREGSGIWTSGFPYGYPVTLGVLFVVGFLFAAAGAYFRNLRLDTGVPTKEEKPTSAPIDNAPFPVWASDADGALTYSNEYYDAFVSEDQRTNAGFSSANPDSCGRQSLSIDGSLCWFSVFETVECDQTLKFAVPANDLVATEQTLKRFMETLSTTFAHLSAGLAVFDADKTLHLFNPALSELLDLDPTWLALRPSISTFLDKLRENRHLPDQKNFLEWRRLLLDLENSAANQNYDGQWVLPDGRVLRVTGQPHSQGAVAFLFEDISAQVMIERQHRSETALNQAVLDKISDAVVVIDPSGSISFANAAFDRELGVDSTGDLSSPNIETLAKSLPATPETTAFFAELKQFISHSNSPAWEGSITSIEGAILTVNVASTPDGSTLAVLEKRHRVADLSAIPPTTRESLQGFAFDKLSSALDGFLDTSRSTENIAALRSTRNQIQSVYEMASAMFTPPTESTSMQHDTLNVLGLEAFLQQRNITLDVDEFDQSYAETLDAAKTRRILWYLVLAASNTCCAGGTIYLVSKATNESTAIFCRVSDEDVMASSNSHLSVSLLRQLVDQAGGGAHWVFDDNASPMTISCIMPTKHHAVITGAFASSIH